MITDSFLAEVRQTTQRYEARTPEREENKRVIEEHGVLHADPPELVEKRLDRLGVDWGLARAVERTARDASSGRSLDEELAPDSFGADVLGLERLMGRNDLVDVVSSSGLPGGALDRPRQSGRRRRPLRHRFLVSPAPADDQQPRAAHAGEAGDQHVEFNYQDGLDGSRSPP